MTDEIAMQDGTSLSPGHIDVTGFDVQADTQPDADTPGLVRNQCAGVHDILARVGDKWSVMIVVILGNGPRRFSELKRTVDGISQRMLTLTLRGLERDGLVSRTVTPIIPPRVDYELTDLGRSLWPPLRSLGEWARANRATVDAARVRYDGGSS